MKARVRWRRTGTFCVTLLVLAGLTVACGQPPTSSDKAGSGGDDANAGASQAFAKVYAELDGLRGEQRTDKLAELARAEGELLVYTSNTTLQQVLPAFEKKFGIRTDVYRAQSQTVSQRAHEEAAAGRAGSDIIDNTAEYQQIAAREGVLTEYQGPVRDALPQIAKGAAFTANQYTVFAVAWNTDRVPAAERPASYEDLKDPRWSGKVLIDPRHDAMYFALHDHFVRAGWSEQKFRDLFAAIGKNAVVMEGGTARANSVVSGEHSASIGPFIHEVDAIVAEGARISWQPAVEPIFVEPVGSGLTAAARHPAAALLFYEWIATEGQRELAKLSRVTTSEFVEGGRLAGLDLLTIDYEKYVDERTHWEDQFHQLIGYR